MSDEEQGVGLVDRGVGEYQPLLVNSGEVIEDGDSLFESTRTSCIQNSGRNYRNFIHWLVKDLHQHRLFTLPKREHLKHFVQGSMFVLNDLWAPAFWGMFLHDLICYALYPLERFGISYWQLWLGVATNQITLTSNLGSDVIGPVAPVLIPTAVAVGGLVWAIPPTRSFLGRAYDATLGKLIEIYPEGLRGLYLKNISRNVIQKPYKSYVAWKNGEEEPLLRMKIVKEAVFLPVVLAVFYANIRLLWLDIWKIFGFTASQGPRTACQAQNKLYVYLNDYGDEECVVVDWDFIDDSLKFTNQDALRGLLQYSQDPDFIISKLNELFRSTPFFQSLDLSRQNWKQWTPAQWKNLLTTVSNHLTQLKSLILGTPVPDNFSPQPGFMEALGDFLNKVKTTNLIFPNQGIGDQPFNQLTPALSGFSTVDVRYDRLRNVSGFSGHSQNLESVTVSGNPIQNTGVKILSDELSKASSKLTEINAENVGMDEDGLATLGSAITKGKIRKVAVGGDDLSQGDFVAFGQNAASGGVQEVSVRQAQLSDQQVVDFVSQSEAGNVASVDFSQNYVSDDGVVQIAQQLNRTTISRVKLSGTSITAAGVKALVSVTTLKELDISNNPIGDDVVLVLGATSTNVVRINLANTGLTPDGATQLSEALSSNLSHVTSLNIAGNNLPDNAVAGIVGALANGQIIQLNLEGNRVGPNTTSVLVRVLPTVPMQNLVLRNTQLSDACGVQIAKALIQNTPDSDQIGSPDISREEILAIRKAASTTSLVLLDISKNPYGRTAKIAFRQVLPSTNITEFVDNSTSVFTGGGDFFDPSSKWQRESQPSNVSYSTQSLLPGSSSNASQSSSLILGLAIAGPAILVLLLIIYMFRRTDEKNGEDSLCKPATRTLTRQ